MSAARKTAARKTAARKTAVRREDLAPGACLCDHCTGKCCRYFALPLPRTPRTWDDFDEIRWYLAHGRTLVYVEKGDWYLLVMTRCRYLTAEDRCAIYHDRPAICRDYSSADCEYDDDWSFERIFETPEQIAEYAEAILPPRRRAASACRAGAPLVSIGPAPAPRAAPTE